VAKYNEALNRRMTEASAPKLAFESLLELHENGALRCASFASDVCGKSRGLQKETPGLLISLNTVVMGPTTATLHLSKRSGPRKDVVTGSTVPHDVGCHKADRMEQTFTVTAKQFLITSKSETRKHKLRARRRLMGMPELEYSRDPLTTKRTENDSIIRLASLGAFTQICIANHYRPFARVESAQACGRSSDGSPTERAHLGRPKVGVELQEARDRRIDGVV
jgi:hypothetical protein